MFGTILKALIQSMLRPFGLRLSRLETAPKWEYGATALFTTLKRFGFAPRHILDIGANHGNWTRDALLFFPQAQFTLVEPQDHLKVHIRDLVSAGHKLLWVNLGIADQSGTLPFHFSQRDDSSTFAPPHGDVPMETRLVEVKTLDDLLTSYGLPVPEMIKIDAEGFDLKVMDGARSVLGKTDVFLLEASVTCPYENTVLKTVNRMNELGYRLIDITEINRSPKYGVLWLMELAFLRNTSPLLDAATSYE